MTLAKTPAQPVALHNMQELERQKKRSDGLVVPPPAHWHIGPSPNNTYFLPLPFDGGARPAEPALNPSTVYEMTRQVGPCDIRSHAA